jgi:hypothetical protein
LAIRAGAETKKLALANGIQAKLENASRADDDPESVELRSFEGSRSRFTLNDVTTLSDVMTAASFRLKRGLSHHLA